MAQENANPARENLKYLCFIVLSAVVSIAVCYSYLENNNQANQIGELQKNLGEIMVSTQSRQSRAVGSPTVGGRVKFLHVVHCR